MFAPDGLTGPEPTPATRVTRVTWFRRTPGGGGTVHRPDLITAPLPIIAPMPAAPLQNRLPRPSR